MNKLTLLLSLAAISVFGLGCEPPVSHTSGSNSSNDHGHEHGPEGHEGHDHANSDHTAPHGGHLIELGYSHEYHAELVDNHETESVTIYIMDGDMKPLSIDQASVSLVLTAGDNTQTFELPESQLDGSSEFTSNDEKLMEMIDTEGVTGKLRVTIKDKPYSGTFEHTEHDHDDHDGHKH